VQSRPRSEVPFTFHVPGEDGVEVAVHDYGGDGHPTVFVHGTGLCSRMWEPVIRRLPAGRIRALGVDLRGHGATRTPTEVDFHDHRMVSDLHAVTAALGLSGAWAAAHSMGAGTALLAEARRPGTFARLWCYEPIIFPRSRPDGESSAEGLAESTRRRRPTFSSREEAAARYASRPPLDELDPEALSAYVTHGMVDDGAGGVRLACDPEHEARAFEQYLQQGFDELGAVGAPALIVHGRHSVEAQRQWFPVIAAALPHGLSQEFPESGHFGPFGDVDRTVASLRGWLLGES
jgi:pimeloyl-ACP methyl ester carboxylesterase